MAGQNKAKIKKLMEKSQELFWEFGYNAVSMDQIAAETGISKMTIYKYYNSKEDLFIEVLKNNVEYHTNMIMGKIDEKHNTFDKIEFIYKYSMDLVKQYPITLLKDIIERKGILEKVITIKQDMTLPIWRHILEEGIRKKEIRDMDIDFVSELLMNLPSAVKNMKSLVEENKQHEFYESFFDFIKYGMLGGIKC
jgi:AcrR family transcriptional regulator